MSTAVSNPEVTINNLAATIFQGLDDQRCVIVAPMTTGLATAGALETGVPRSDAKINRLFGGDSYAAALSRHFRKVNKNTNLDVIPLADAAGATKGMADWTLAGTATHEGRYILTVFGEDYRYILDVLPDETPSVIMSKLISIININQNKPFSAAVVAGKLTLTANNSGNVSDDWPVVVEGRVPGLTYTLNGFTGGATDPVLDTVFDPVETVRYQGVGWPGAYDIATLKNFIEPRWNVTNAIMDGRAFVGINLDLEPAKAKVLQSNARMICFIGNEPSTTPDRKGSHLPESPDLTAIYFMAVRALRFEDGVSISPHVLSKVDIDQFGGKHTASLPYFNTENKAVGRPKRGSGWSGEEQREAEHGGISVVGLNTAGTSVVYGNLVTTKLFDAASNAEEGSRYLNWIDTESVVREILAKNIRASYSQARMSSGTVSQNGVVTEKDVRSTILLIFKKMANQSPLIVKGLDAENFMKDNLKVKAVPSKRRFEFQAKAWLVSQAGAFIGSIEYVFDI